ncbi:MAG: flagellar filament capping protein FliD [Terracidiphilus sp.]
MGTVGLSFGSPTSGAGFDVSSTVSQIVSNLQNVETPWKNQLTSLESQDTVISNLGTLVSSLSTDMSSLTDFQGVLAQKEGSSSDTNVLQLSSATSSATAGTHSIVVENLAQTSSGYLDEVSSISDTLAGSITIKVNGSSQTYNLSDLSSSNQTLSGLAAAINSSGIGVTANVLTDSSGSRLSLVSATTGAAGQMTIASGLTDAKLASASNTTGAINYNATVPGKDANLNVDGVPLTSASNTVSNLIPGVTFQLLSASPQQSDGSLEPVQVVIANNNSGVETAVNQFVTDYNSLMSALNTQEGKDSSGNSEPLFGSPTLSLLQQQMFGGLNTTSPNGYLDSVTADDGVTLSGSLTVSLGNGTKATFQVGAGTSGNGTFFTGSGNGYNTLDGLAAAINAESAGTAVTYSGNSSGDSGTFTASNTSALSGAAPELAGSFTVQVGAGATQTVSLDDVNSAEGGTTLSDIAQYINDNSSTLGATASITDNGDGTSSLSLSTASLSGGALTVSSNLAIPGLGVNAAVVTKNGESSLTLVNQAVGTNGALSVTSAITASTPTTLNYADTQSATGSTTDSGAFGEVNATDSLGGSVVFQVGSGIQTTITMDQVEVAQGGTTLDDLAHYIHSNSAALGIDATTVSNSDGTESLSLESNTEGSAGAMSVTSNLYNSSQATSTTLHYTSSSDINNLTSLGISVNNDGTLTFDASALDSLLNTDFASVVGFFQNANSWGQTFNNILNNAGTSSSTGILKLAQTSNSNIESSLNAEIAKEDALIATQKTKLTAELNQANEIMQELPSQLTGMDELYSAITGYNQKS